MTEVEEIGFGFEKENGKYVIPYKRRPHPYSIKIDKDVEINSGVTIHRGRWRDTEIGEGTRIDSNVHIAHNVKIGKNCLITACACIGGSVTIGDGCFLGLNCTIKDGIKIADNVTIGCGSVVIKDIEQSNSTWAGVPARKVADVQKY